MKRIIFPLILALFLLPLAIGISVDVKPVYQPGETLIAEIKGNIIEPISSEDVRNKKEQIIQLVSSTISSVLAIHTSSGARYHPIPKQQITL